MNNLESKQNLTHEAQRWCSGDSDWTNWQPCTTEKAAEYAKDDSFRVRRLTSKQILDMSHE